ncbi:MAG: hypothetical protein R3A79_20335 [Nannocystaceae bacterium]
MSKLAQLRSAALPFVTRAHRGGRLRRFVLMSVLLGVLTLILGAWISFGNGPFEAEIRRGFDLEESRWMREQQEFIVVVDSREELAQANAQVASLPYDHSDMGWNRPKAAYDDAVQFVTQATWTDAPRGGYAMRDRAANLLASHGLSTTRPDPDTYYTYFSWHDAENVARLQAILAADLRPQIELYESPLTVVEGIRVTGAIAGGIFTLLLLVIAPLLVGTQMAQEVHENTLMPLTGTALRTRELILGMAAGALSIVGILAAPQALILLATVAATGYLLPALAGILVAVVGCFFLSTLAQLLGYALGSQRTPGVLGMGLLAFFGFFGMVGAAFGLAPHRQTIGILALLPEAATTHLFRSSLLPHELFFSNWRLAHEADFAIAVGTVGLGLLGILGMRALERRVGRTGDSALTRPEALLGAFVTTVLVILANPARHAYAPVEASFLLTLAILSVPFAIFLMMRAPFTQHGAERKPMPVVGLLGELALWAGLHGVVTLIVIGRPELLAAVHPMVFAYLGWYLLVLGLLALRVVARPMGIGARVWVAFSALFAMFAFPQMAAWMRPWANHGLSDALLFLQVSPFLGFVQAILLVLIPWSLWRSLRRAA